MFSHLGFAKFLRAWLYSKYFFWKSGSSWASLAGVQVVWNGHSLAGGRWKKYVWWKKADLKQLNMSWWVPRWPKKPQGHLVWILQQGLHWGKLAFMELIPVFLSPLQDEGSSMDFELPAACACCLWWKNLMWMWGRRKGWAPAAPGLWPYDASAGLDFLFPCRSKSLLMQQSFVWGLLELLWGRGITLAFG